MSAPILSAEKLFAILRTRAEQSFTLERNAIPYLMQNNSELTLDNGAGGTIAPGEYLVVQPSGKFHKTNPDLHEKTGNWRKHVFNQLDEASVEAVTAATGAATTSKEQIDAAISGLVVLNQGLNSDDLTPVGWSPSISKTIAYQIPPALKGAKIKQPWGEQIIDPSTEVLVIVVGDTTDCYANAKADMVGWSSIDIGTVGLSGDALVTKLPLLSLKELGPAMAWEHRIDRPDLRIRIRGT